MKHSMIFYHLKNILALFFILRVILVVADQLYSSICAVICYFHLFYKVSRRPIITHQIPVLWYLVSGNCSHSWELFSLIRENKSQEFGPIKSWRKGVIEPLISIAGNFGLSSWNEVGLGIENSFLAINPLVKFDKLR